MLWYFCLWWFKRAPLCFKLAQPFLGAGAMTAGLTKVTGWIGGSQLHCYTFHTIGWTTIFTLKGDVAQLAVEQLAWDVTFALLTLRPKHPEFGHLGAAHYPSGLVLQWDQECARQSSGDGQQDHVEDVSLSRKKGWNMVTPSLLKISSSISHSKSQKFRQQQQQQQQQQRQSLDPVFSATHPLRQDQYGGCFSQRISLRSALCGGTVAPLRRRFLDTRPVISDRVPRGYPPPTPMFEKTAGRIWSASSWLERTTRRSAIIRGSFS